MASSAMVSTWWQPPASQLCQFQHSMENDSNHSSHKFTKNLRFLCVCVGPIHHVTNSSFTSTGTRKSEGVQTLTPKWGMPLSNPNTLASLLEDCTNTKALSEGKQFHAQMVTVGLVQNNLLGAKLVNMYATCGCMAEARLVFDRATIRDALIWNAIIRGYTRSGPCEEALALYSQMQREGIRPDNFTFPCVLNACGALGTVQQGKEIHTHILRSGFESNVIVGTALIDAYAKRRNIGYARQVFDKMPQRDVVSWNAMIAGYVQNGYAEKAVELFGRMQLSGMVPSTVTVVTVLAACAALVDLERGKRIHDYVKGNGFESDVMVGSALVHMYVSCGVIEVARQMFDKMSRRDVVLWSVMIAGYVQKGYADEALKLFGEMQLRGVKLDSDVIATVLPACAHLTSLQQGKEIHGHVIRRGFGSDVFVGSALIDMYAKCGSLEIARHVFDKMSERDVVSWSAMIAGHAQNGHANMALKLLHQMQQVGVKADSVTIVSLLVACSQLATLQQGKEVHGYIIRNGFEFDVFAVNALIDMYAKCGSIECAYQVFKSMSKRDVVSWNTMIAGYGMHGQGEEAVAHFHQMHEAGMNPNYITFVAVLSACSHAGLVDEGWHFFNSMTEDYHISPGVEHYTSMVDLLGRAGYLNEAHDFIRKMPFEPSAAVWGALLGACRVHCNTELGERVFECLLRLDPENDGNYVLLSNIYAAAGRWDDVGKIRKLMKARGVEKSPGCSWIEVKNSVHAFVAGDRSHPQSEKIYAMLESLTERMKKAGYEPDISFVLRNVEEEQKEDILCGHSEKLAIAFGLINTWPGTPIHVTKNLRMCGDCHSAIKLISSIVKLKITVRDVKRFHHFEDGLCSCGDYW